MSTPYERGVYAERLVMRELQEQGYAVIRSAGSHGPADLVAWLRPQVRIIQVKRCRAVLQLKRAILEATRRFDQAGAFFAPQVSFEVVLLYKGAWVRLERLRSYWNLVSPHADLLGQSVWPALENERV